MQHKFMPKQFPCQTSILQTDSCCSSSSLLPRPPLIHCSADNWGHSDLQIFPSPDTVTWSCVMIIRTSRKLVTHAAPFRIRKMYRTTPSSDKSVLSVVDRANHKAWAPNAHKRIRTFLSTEASSVQQHGFRALAHVSSWTMSLQLPLCTCRSS